MRWRWRLRRRRGPGDGGNAELDARLSEAWEAGAAAVGTMLDLPAGKQALLASSGLVQEGTADLRTPAGPARDAARRGRHRRLPLRSVAAVAAALIAGAVALAAVGVPGAGHDGTKGPVVDAASVVKRVDSALSAAGPGQIAQMTVTTTGSAAIPGGTTSAEEWSYGGQWRSVTYSPAGHPVYDESFSTSSVYTLVNYQTRTWARQPGLGRPAAPVPPVPGPRGCAPVVAALPSLFQPALPGPNLPASSLPSTVASALRAAVSCGTLATAGQQRVNGIEAIKLTSRPGSPIAETIWVSPDTYLPVRVVLRLGPGTPVFQRTADITWLPPTTQNLAQLTVPIPAGFRQASLNDVVMPILPQFLPGPLSASQVGPPSAVRSGY
jgi:hypothetical protein